MNASEAVDKDALRKRFRRAEHEVIAALNGIGRPVADHDEVVGLRRELLRVMHECEAAGVVTETLEQFARRRQAENTELVRGYATSAMQVSPLIPRARRRRIAAAVALAIAGLLLGYGVAVWWAIAGGVLAMAATNAACMELFPTPAVRVARRAFELEVDVAELWPAPSDERRDYLETLFRLRGRTRPQTWIKTR